MVKQKTVLKALLYFSVVVFVSIWLLTSNFPERQCDCSKCVKFFQESPEFQFKWKRNVQDDEFISTSEAQIRSGVISTSNRSVQAVNQKEKILKPMHKLGVIVPYRDRFEELLEFVPYMSKYFNQKNISFHMYIINQVDNHRFNRASLINIGFLIAVSESCDYIAMHDVDLLPQNKDLDYGFPDGGPFHVSAPHLHPKYHYPKFIGGILLMTAEHFRKVNGLSTLFWGWGREDDELYMRIQDANLSIGQPVGIKSGYNTFKHNHGKKRKRDYPRTRTQFKASFHRDRLTGLSTMDHKVLTRHELTVGGEALSMVAVELKCNYTATPWCD